MLATALKLVERQPWTTAEFGTLLLAKYPERDVTSLAYACRNLLPLVQVPPRGVWGKGGKPYLTTAEHWIGKSLNPLCVRLC